MNPDLWSAVDDYFVGALIAKDPNLEAARAANARADLPAIDVSPSQGKLLQLLVQTQQARRILEVGTLGGYSTLWMAQALPPNGLLVTLEADPHHAAVARANIQRAGFDHLVRLVEGKALETLPQVQHDYPEPFDLIFIDADKVNTPEYFRWGLRLSRTGHGAAGGQRGAPGRNPAGRQHRSPGSRHAAARAAAGAGTPRVGHRRANRGRERTRWFYPGPGPFLNHASASAPPLSRQQT